MSSKDFFYLTIILFIGLLLRLYNITTPLADLHSWRQADTAAVARNFVNNGFNLMQPKYDDFSTTQSGIENPQGLRFVEFPIYNASFAILYKLFPYLPIEVYGRIVSIFFSLILISIIYYLLLKETGRFTAIIGAGMYSIFPFFVFFSRTVLPETTALSLAFLAIFLLYLSKNLKDKKSTNFLLFFSSLCFSVGVLIKPTVIFFFIPILYLLFRKWGTRLFKKPFFYLYLTVLIVPFILWRSYISQFPEGIPPSDWLINQVNTAQGRLNIFFRPAFFRWIFYERINNIIMGGFASFFLILGLLYKHKNYFFYSILLSSLLYLFVFQGGNIQHEYYQILILPFIAIFTALGVSYLRKYYKQLISPLFSISFVIIIFLFSYAVSFYTVKNYYNYPKDLISISKVIKDLTRKEDKIITDTMGDTTLLYLSERRGSPVKYADLEDLKNKGYSHFVTLNKELTNQLIQEKRFNMIFNNDKFSIFQL
jgi:4-amino-4-deoxy-L-arabinose transferase-like glycosyltransferase